MARASVALIFATVLSLSPLISQSAVVAPLVPGKFSGADGANSHWVQVRSEWRGPTFGNEAWGTGIWSISDAGLVSALAPADAHVIKRFDGKVDQIHFANDSYNFGILFDDGFQFNLFGGNGQSLAIEKDGLNPRERIGFSENLDLAAGMYGYRLLAYNRLEAGVVDLSWIREDRDWQVIPKDNLFTKIPPINVPEPSTLALLGIVLVGAGLVSRRKPH